MSKMARFCMPTVTPVNIKRDVHGKWILEGIKADRYLEGIEFSMRMLRPYNMSIYTTSRPEECLERLTHNQSDISNAFISIRQLASGYFVPEVFSAGKVQFITGYNVSEDEVVGEETATALGNVALLQAEVYLCALLLTLAFVGFIAARIWLFTRSPRPEKKLRLIRKEVDAMFYYSSERFKLISTLFCVLCFYIITSFLCLYKTSHVIVEKPFYPKSYQESLDHKTSLAFFLDILAVVSDGFKSAPKDTVKGKLWIKLLASGRTDAYDYGQLNLAMLPMRVKNASREMTEFKGISVASPLSMPLLRSMACGGSPEGQLWIMKVSADPAEQEVIFGPALRKTSPFSSLYARRFKRSFETHVLYRMYMRSLDLIELAGSFMGTSSTHRWKQQVVCENEDAFTLDPEVKAIPLSYFRSFFLVCSVIWLLALIVNLVQIAWFRSSRANRTGRPPATEIDRARTA